MKKNISVFFLLFLIINLFARGLLNTFFQQDEWNGFGVIITMVHKPLWAWFNLATSLHFFPLNSLTWLMMYRAYEYNAQYYIVTAIVIHTIASFLVYVLAQKLSKNNMVGLLTAILFATNSRARTAFMHLGVFSNTVPFVIFVVLFFIYLVSIAKRTIYGVREALLLLLFFFSAVFFREEGVILIPLLPIFLYIYNRRALSKKNLRFFVTFYGFSIAFLCYRIFLQVTTPNADKISGREYFLTYLYNVLTFPIKLIVQNLIDGYYAITVFLFQNYKILYPFDISPQIVSTVLFDFAIVLLFITIVLLFIQITKHIKDTLFWKNIYFSLILVFMHAGVLAAIGRRMERIEERYLYLSAFAVLFMFSLVLINIYKLKVTNKLVNTMKQFVLVVIVLGMLLSSYIRIQTEIASLEREGRIRKHILSQIVTLHPTIPNHTIFFVRCKGICKRNSEFGLSNNLVLPFSSGPGWIILLQYAKNNEEAYHKFFVYHGEQVLWDWKSGQFRKMKVKEFLWDMGAQGYRRIGNYSFGYFTDRDFLKETLAKERLDKKVVIGLEYDEKDFTIRDISSDIQKEL